jgi:hypothetical protein
LFSALATADFRVLATRRADFLGMKESNSIYFAERP